MGEESEQSCQVEVNDHHGSNDPGQTTAEVNKNPILEQNQLIEDIKETIPHNEGETNTENEVAWVEIVAETDKNRAGEQLETKEMKGGCPLEENDQYFTNTSQPTIESKENPTVEQEQQIEHVKEARPENEEEITIENQNAEVGKVEEVDTKHAGLLKKPKAVAKKKYLRTPTIPQPFSLATERRLAREKQSGSLQTTESKSKLSKSVSLNLKVNTQSSNGTKQISELRRGASVASKSILTKNSTLDKRTQNGTKFKENQLKDIDSKNTQANAKDGEETKLDKLKKSTTFKASPLPSFYHKREPLPKHEPTKVPVTHHKSPQLGQQSKSLAEGKKANNDNINKSASRAISTTAKETIHKLLKGALKAPSSQQKKVVKSSSSISRGNKLQKETI